MTDVREIISNALARAKHDDHPNWTGFIMNQLDRAGFRILGPDEVDPVTVEKCAEEMESLAQFLRDDADKIVAEWTGQDFSDDENRANHQDARERRGRAPIYESAAAAIRALGRTA